MTASNCKTMPCGTFLRMRGTDKLYQEALEASTKYNRRMLIDRKTRIPFIDSQTRVAQTNSIMWYNLYHREVNVKSSKADGKVYTYPVKQWIKKRRLNIESDVSLSRLPSYDASLIAASHSHHNENSNSTDSMQPHYTRYSSAGGASGSLTSTQATLGMDQDVMGGDQHEWQMHEESYDYLNEPNDDNDSDFDDYEDSRRKKGKKSKNIKRRSEIPADEKPFVCDKCGVKYKTKPGLTYHIQKLHNKNGNKAESQQQQSPQLQQQLLQHHQMLHQLPPAYHSQIARELGLPPHPNALPPPHMPMHPHPMSQQPHGIPMEISHNGEPPTPSNVHRTPSSLTQDENTNGTNEDSNQAPSSTTTTTTKSKLCTLCSGMQIDDPELRQRNGGDSSLVSCCECTRSYHPVCLNFTQTMITKVRKYNWQCIECKKCVLCGNSENDDKLLFCDDCDSGYHMYCLNPPLLEAPDGDWHCELCVKNPIATTTQQQ